MLIERALDMELLAALVVRRGIDHVEGDTDCGGRLDAGLKTKIRYSQP
jgi:hypothetical protein